MILSSSGHSFEALCLPHRAELVNFARRLTRNVPRAEDIVQDAYVSALVAWSSFAPDGMDPGQAARAWLYRIVGNKFANLVRDHKLHRDMHFESRVDIVGELYGEVEMIRCPTDERESGDAVLSARRTFLVGRRDPVKMNDDVSSEVLVAVERLSPKRRAAVRRYYFDGETCEMIGAALGVPASSVRSLLARARTKLSPLLRHYAQANYELGSARVDPRPKATKGSKAKPDRVQRIVRQRHRRTLRAVKQTPYQAATG